jgi:2-polyprenyl-3-methyl-5-hydroxy-6-metoxy-1,4-benzoquinol methylase
MASTSCIVCGGSYASYRVPGLQQCSRCTFVTTDLSLSAEELKKLYSDTYFMGEEYRNYIEEKKTIQKNFDARVKDLLRLEKQPEQKDLFEIGAAYGFFLERVKKHFKSVSGIDISENATAYAKAHGNAVVCQDFLEYALPKKYDVFCMWDTIEHLQSPHLYIEKVSRNITPGGLLAITTGDIDSLNARIRGAKWRQIHPPTHLHYFSAKTLKKLLEKNGFTVVRSSHVGNYHSLDDIFYIIFVLKNKNKKLYELVKKSGLLRVIQYIYLNFFDLSLVIARKNAE